MMKFDLDKAINDKYYAGYIEFYIKYNDIIDKNKTIIRKITYDDIIYTFTIIYGTGININVYMDIFNKNPSKLASLFTYICLYHTIDFEDAITEMIIDIFYGIFIKFDEKDFKDYYESRRFIEKNFIPILKYLYENIYLENVNSNNSYNVKNWKYKDDHDNLLNHIDINDLMKIINKVIENLN